MVRRARNFLRTVSVQLNDVYRVAPTAADGSIPAESWRGEPANKSRMKRFSASNHSDLCHLSRVGSDPSSTARVPLLCRFSFLCLAWYPLRTVLSHTPSLLALLLPHRVCRRPLLPRFSGSSHRHCPAHCFFLVFIWLVLGDLEALCVLVSILLWVSFFVRVYFLFLKA